jgi:hypothetical protein
MRFVFNGCKTSSVSQWKERRLREYENKVVLRKISGVTRKGRGGWKNFIMSFII